ncbi:hypothetical protein GQA94_19750 [Stutzerimonas stutzeri]|uniref:Lipoprotein n=1 Tax=Stutzerimonas stutzeri TaxID=316 RepID=A0A6I6LSI6_STUST|nr:hypothetical protein [Stutzerimonas stutzeri]QGZ32170.1 hypothetical protein GQA94_19750 [Stutzerimonas stutzeri]
MPHLSLIGILLGAMTATTLAGCVAYAEGPYERDRHSHRDHGYEVPKGHLPPPGECRIWYPDRAPGQQPPPGNCRELRRHVPYGATLIRG